MNDELKINDILECSWGYEQTNIDFYQVIKIKGDFVTLKEIEGKHTPQDSQMTTLVIPQPFKFTGKPAFRRKIRYYQGKPSISIESYSVASPWDGSPSRASHYA